MFGIWRPSCVSIPITHVVSDCAAMSGMRISGIVGDVVAITPKTLAHLHLDKMAAIFADDIFTCMFVNEKFCILIRISPKFVHKGPIDNKSALVQIMAWVRTGDIYGARGEDELTYVSAITFGPSFCSVRSLFRTLFQLTLLVHTFQDQINFFQYKCFRREQLRFSLSDSVWKQRNLF